MTNWEKIQDRNNDLINISVNYDKIQREIRYGKQSTNKYKYEYDQVNDFFQSSVKQFLKEENYHTEDILYELLEMELNTENYKMAKNLYKNIKKEEVKIEQVEEVKKTEEESIYIIVEENLEMEVIKLESKKEECENTILQLKNRIKEIEDNIDEKKSKL